MKTFLRGNKIVLRKNEEHTEVEALIETVAEDLERVRSVCEDRNAEDFPENVVRGMVQNIETLKTKGARTYVSEDFLEHAMGGGSVLDYFSKVIEQSRSEEDLLQKKKDRLREFANRLEDILHQRCQ